VTEPAQDACLALLGLIAIAWLPFRLALGALRVLRGRGEI